MSQTVVDIYVSLGMSQLCRQLLVVVWLFDAERGVCFDGGFGDVAEDFSGGGVDDGECVPGDDDDHGVSDAVHADVDAIVVGTDSAIGFDHAFNVMGWGMGRLAWWFCFGSRMIDRGWWGVWGMSLMGALGVVVVLKIG